MEERGRAGPSPPAQRRTSEDGAPAAFAGLARDFPGNPAPVRDYTGFRGSALDGLIRFRYFISHDRTGAVAAACCAEH